jgi:hypothetical protein
MKPSRIVVGAALLGAVSLALAQPAPQKQQFAPPVPKNNDPKHEP